MPWGLFLLCEIRIRESDIYLSTYLPIYLSTYLPIYLSMYYDEQVNLFYSVGPERNLPEPQIRHKNIGAAERFWKT